MKFLAFLRSRGLRDLLTVALAVGLVVAGMRWERAQQSVAVARAQAEAAEAREVAAVAQARAQIATAEAQMIASRAQLLVSEAQARRETVEAKQATRRAARRSGGSAPSDASRSAALMDLERATGFRQ